MDTFEQLQQRLGEAWAAHHPRSGTDHVVVVLPSHTVADSLLAHYGHRVVAFEHRYLTSLLLLNARPDCEMVFVSSQTPGPEVLEYYASLGRLSARGAPARLRCLSVGDGDPRPLSARLLARPYIVSELRASIGGRPAFIQPWNVTDLERQVAVALQAPLLGTPPQLWPLGYKSAGRGLLAEAGVPTAAGHEDVRCVHDVLAAILDLRAKRPSLHSVVIKLDESGAGDGNVVVAVRSADGQPITPAELRERVEALPDWYLTSLCAGGVVEELVTGERVTSPSVQLDITPDGDVTVLATHEQILGGDSGQVYQGCRFPAAPASAPAIARHAHAVGKLLAERGAIGRVGIDFLAGVGPAGDDVLALEINLRVGATTHPYTVLESLVPGEYDAPAGQWRAFDGRPRCYQSTDNMHDPSWHGLPASAVIDALGAAGLRFDPGSGTGVVVHSLSGLAIDGRFGLTAIGLTPAHAAVLHDEAHAAVSSIGQLLGTRAADLGTRLEVLSSMM